MGKLTEEQNSISFWWLGKWGSELGGDEPTKTLACAIFLITRDFVLVVGKPTEVSHESLVEDKNECLGGEMPPTSPSKESM